MRSKHGGRARGGIEKKGKKRAIKITKHAQRYYTRIDLFFEAHQGLEELLEEIRNGPEKQEEEGEKKKGRRRAAKVAVCHDKALFVKNNFHILHLRSLV